MCDCYGLVFVDLCVWWYCVVVDLGCGIGIFYDVCFVLLMCMVL